MKTNQLVELPRKERADRTYQRIVYRKLVDLQVAIRDARRHAVPLGELAELDTPHLVERLCKLADIEYRSIAEQSEYEKPILPGVETVKDVPVIELDDVGVEL